MKKSWANFPFRPARFPIFYGWIILAVGVLGMVASTPGQTNGIGVFTDNLIDAMGVSPFQLSLAYMFGTIISSFCLPYAGRMLDRFGARIMVVFSTVGLGLSLLSLAAMAVIAKAVEVLFAPVPHGHIIAATLVATICFFLVRFFGQGCLAMVSRVMISKWFNYRRGMATGITSVFTALGFMSGPVLLNDWVDRFGWQGTCAILAALVGVGVGALCWLFFRDNPEECGLVMDGIDDPAWLAKQRTRVPETDRDFTRLEAVKTRAFWAYSLAPASQGLIMTAFFFHLTAIAAEQGLTRTEIYQAMLYFPVVSIPATTVAGYISDKIDLKWLLYVMMPMQALGSYAITEMSSTTGQVVLLLGYGVSGGLFGAIVTVSLPRFFGRAHLGAISGLNMSIMVFTSAIGPVFFSGIHYFTGSYREACFASMAIPLLVLILGFRVKNPQVLARARAAQAGDWAK